jgi:hypothetical protein
MGPSLLGRIWAGRAGYETEFIRVNNKIAGNKELLLGAVFIAKIPLEPPRDGWGERKLLIRRDRPFRQTSNAGAWARSRVAR